MWLCAVGGVLFVCFVFFVYFVFFFFQAGAGIRDAQGARGLGDGYKRQDQITVLGRRGSRQRQQAQACQHERQQAVPEPPTLSLIHI